MLVRRHFPEPEQPSSQPEWFQDTNTVGPGAELTASESARIYFRLSDVCQG